MVATVLRLKLRLVHNALRTEPWRVVVTALGVLWVVVMIPGLLGAATWLSRQGVEVAGPALVVLGTLIVLGWAVVPVLVFGADEAVAPRRFAPFGADPVRLAPALLVAAVVSVPTLFLALLAAASLLVWAPGGGAAVLVAAVGAACVFGTCLLAARLATAVAGRLFTARRARALSALVALGVMAVIGAVVAAASRVGWDATLDRLPTLAEILAHTPLGAGWAAPAHWLAGDVPRSLGFLALAAGYLGVGVLAWIRQVDRQLVSAAVVGGQSRRRADAFVSASMRTTTAAGAAGPDASPPAQRAEATATRAVAARARRYWASDPRYLAAVGSTVVMALLIAALAAVAGSGVLAVPAALVVAPLLAGALGWGRHNDTAFDGSAFWLHVAAGMPGRADRWGRVQAVLVWAAPATGAVALAGAWLSGRWDLLPATLGFTWGLLGAGLGVSMVTSAVLPYPAPQPGESPFAAETGSVGASIAAQLVATLATGVAAVPVTVAFWFAVTVAPGAGWAVLLLGVGGGAGLLWLGATWGGRLLDRRGAQLLAQLR